MSLGYKFSVLVLFGKYGISLIILYKLFMKNLGMVC